MDGSYTEIFVDRGDISRLFIYRYVRSRVELTTAEIKDNKEKFWDLKKCLGYIGFTTDVCTCI